MKRKIFTLLMLLTGILNVRSASAQGWSKHGVGLSSSVGICVVDISAPTDNVAWAIFAQFSQGTCGGIVPYVANTTNGNSWFGQVIFIPGNLTPFCISAIDANTAWIITANIGSNTTGRIYKTTNGGTSWALQPTALMADAGRYIHFYNPNEGVAIGDSSVYTTVDGGTHWNFTTNLPVPVANVGSGRTIFLLNAYEFLGDKIWLGDAYGNFYKSNDRGQSWSLILPAGTPASVKGIAFSDSLHGIAAASVWITGGGNGGGYDEDASVITNDGGITWQANPICFPSVNVDCITAKYDVAYVPGTTQTFIATSEYDSIWAAYSAISNDGGLTWSLIDSTEQHTVCVFTNPTNGYTGGYIPDFTRGIYKWSGTLPTGVEEIESAIGIFPNPFSDYLTIDLKSELNRKNLISLFNVDGKLIRKLSCSEKSIQLDLRDIASGIYFLKIENEKSTMVKRIVRE